MEERKRSELEHSRRILHNHGDSVWGWSTPAGKLRLNRRAGFVNNLISKYPDKDNLNILELGCGTGLFTEKLLCPQKFRLIILDVYEGFVRKTYDRTKKADRAPLFLVADVEKLPFLNQSFDIIIGISVLHHLDLNLALREIGRVLKSGGRFIFSEPNMLNPQIFIQKNVGFVKKYLGDSPCETAFFPFGLKNRFMKYGLKTWVMPFDFLHPKLPSVFVPCMERLGLVLEKIVFSKYISGSLLIQGEKV